SWRMDSTQRDLLAVYMDYLVAHNNAVKYRLTRPNPARSIVSAAALFKAIQHDDVEADCSGGIDLLFHLARCKPPSGAKYGWGYGNTKTMLDHLPHFTDARKAHVGAIFIFGADQDDLLKQHAAVVRRESKRLGNPTLWSLGGPGDPVYWKKSVLQDSVP